MSEMVNHPKHYNSGKIEVIEFLEDQQLEPHEWNVVKYVCRAKHKGRRIEDLEKAVWYLRRKIELLKAEAEGRDPVRPNDMNNRINLTTEEIEKLKSSIANVKPVIQPDPANCGNCGHSFYCHVSGEETIGGCDFGGFNRESCGCRKYEPGV